MIARYALTLVRPWPWAIFRAGKDVENRSWTPVTSKLSTGDWLAIHAGARWDEDGAEWIRELLQARVSRTLPAQTLPPMAEHPAGAIVGVARFAGIVRSSSTSPWYFGPLGWLLTEPRELAQPIPCRGALGLWPVPEHARKIIERIT